MRKRFVLTIAILAISLLAGCGQNLETADTGAPTMEQVNPTDGGETEPISEPMIGENIFAYEMKEDGTVKITGLTDSTLKEITIPEQIAGSTVTEIGSNAFNSCSGLTNITLPGRVTELGDSVLLDCSGLTSVTIQEGVMEISWRAFKGCSGLTSITIPESVTDIDYEAFDGCENFTIYCVAGSYAENFAKEKGIAYVTE